jgi:hypothetical protein
MPQNKGLMFGRRRMILIGAFGFFYFFVPLDYTSGVIGNTK